MRYVCLFLLAGLSGSGWAACSGCSTLKAEPTLSNGGCANSSYNCYVYPRYECDTTRLVNRSNCTEEFLTKSGTWSLYNSNGVVLGSFSGGGKIKVNCGIRAVSGSILGMLMCFSKSTNTGTYSGWLTTEAMAESTTGNYDTQPNNPGGDVSLWYTSVSDNSIYLDGAGNSFKVTGPSGCSEGGQNATDYLTRDPGTRNNMVYNLPGTGYGSATEGVRTATNKYNFYRYKNVTSVDRDLYNCNIGAYSSRKLKFLYGRQYEKQIARDGSSVIISRRGWTAIDCLTPGTGLRDY